MRIEFVKMHGTGNDYIFFDCKDGKIPDGVSDFVKKISKRRFSIGGDGAVFICPSNIADAKMVMYNADGSEGKMCGNAIRCVAKYICKSGNVKIETASGIKEVTIDGAYATVKMGKANFAVSSVPVRTHRDEFINCDIAVMKTKMKVTSLSVGNPHAVVFVKNFDKIDVEKAGREIEYNKLFPERTNVEFVKIIDTHTIEMRVWERGSGITLSCGSGACAAVAAGVKLGFIKEYATVVLEGGTLYVTCDKDFNIELTGDAHETYRGTYETES